MGAGAAAARELMRKRPGVRGKRPAVDRVQAFFIRLTYEADRRDGMTDEAARARLAALYKIARGTLDDIIEQRKTYAPDYEARPKSKERHQRAE
jgi:hypothetical protein